MPEKENNPPNESQGPPPAPSESSQLLLEINQALTSILDLKELLRATSVLLRNHLPHDFAGLAIYDEQERMFRPLALENPPEFLGTAPLLPLEGTPDGLAFRTRQTVWRDRLDLDEFPAPIVKQVYAAGMRSGCSAPLVLGDRVIGVLAVASKRECSLSRTDAELIQLIANQLTIAVQNALNYERARSAEREAMRTSDRLQLVLNVHNAIASTRDLSALFRIVSTCLREVFRQDYAVMGLYDDAIKQLRVFALDRKEEFTHLEEGQIAQLEGTPVGKALETRQPVLVTRENYASFPAEVVRRALEQGFRTNCSVPLLRQNRIVGAMSIVSKTDDAFTKEDAGLLFQIAGQIAIAVENALAFREIESLKNKLAEEKLYLEEEINTAYNFEEVIGSSPVLRRILKQVETVAPTDSTVLIQGETGTGKELIARAIHNLSARRDRTLVKLNCAAIPGGLLESELFGHEKGAFTGAIAQRIGRFELANKGTLFLDEVGEIPLELQPKLLRVLQEQEFERLGNARTQRVDVRLIAATNRDLAQMSAENRYRSDLYYRLNVFPITIPPLRERPEDIPLLVRFFANKFAGRMKKQIETIPKEAISVLQQYHWPGNIRELENMIERAVILTQGAELQIPLPEIKLQPRPTLSASAPAAENDGSLEAIERDAILRVLRETNWVVGGPAGAAAKLGMKRTTLQNRMRKLGISKSP